MPGNRGKMLKEVLGILPDGVDVGEFSRRWRLTNLELPACGRVTISGGCLGVVMNNGLYTQCKSKVCENGFCRRCINSFVEEGMPKLGLWSERMEKKDWRTTDGRKPITYMQYLKKMKMTREDGEEFLRSKDVDVNKIPASEWELPTKRRGRTRIHVEDSDEEVERKTFRLVPITGKKKCPTMEESLAGKSGSKVRVCVYRESGTVIKVNPTNWTDEANARFAALYCGGDITCKEGKDYGKTSKPKKKDAAANQLQAALNEQMEKQAALEAEMAKMKAAYEAKLAAVHDTWEGAAAKSQNDVNIESVEASLEDSKKLLAAELAEKKRKEAAVKKMRAEKKAKADAEKKAKAEAEKKAKVAEMKRQLAALEAENQELGEFDSSDDDEDDEAQEFNPYEHNDVTYHRDDEDKLYTEEGDYWGYINDAGEVVEGEE